MTFLLLAAVGHGPGVLVGQASLQSGDVAPRLILLLVATTGWILAHGAIACGVAKDADGGAAGPMDLLLGAVGVRGPFLVVTLVPCILVGVVGAVGLLLPTLWLLAVLFPLAAVVTIEQRGPFDALRRTAALTRGHRWPILGAAMAALLLAVATCCPASSCVAGFELFRAEGDLTDSAMQSALTLAINYVTTTVQIVIVSSTAGAAYAELRHAQELAPPPVEF